jgi:hypothetical protein
MIVIQDSMLIRALMPSAMPALQFTPPALHAHKPPPDISY